MVPVRDLREQHPKRVLYQGDCKQVQGVLCKRTSNIRNTGMDENNKGNWQQRRYYMGLDWAKKYHEIVVVDRDGRIVLDLRIEHTADVWVSVG